MVPAPAAAHTAHSLLRGRAPFATFLSSSAVLLLVLLSLSLSLPSFAAAENGGGLHGGIIHADGGRFVSEDGGTTFYVVGSNTYYLGKGLIRFHPR